MVSFLLMARIAGDDQRCTNAPKTGKVIAQTRCQYDIPENITLKNREAKVIAACSSLGLFFLKSNTPSPIQTDIQDPTNVSYAAKIRKERTKISELCVMWVIEPGRNRDRILGVESIRCWRVVQNDGI